MGMKDIMMQTIEEIVSKGASKKVGHLWATDKQFEVPYLEIDNKKLVSFVLCDYLSLSQDERVINRAIEMLKRYGTYTAVSRAFVNLDLTRQTENLLGSIFNKPVAIIARTTLAHLAVLPVITQTTDAIILDHQVHTSVRNAVDMLKPYGNRVEVIRHNRMDQLESRLQKFDKTHTKIWYMADGIYSMYGDTLPVSELLVLLDKYPKLNVYVDDAHGMSWQGENGSGFVLNHMPYHERLFLVTSLGKGFGSGGAAIVCPNKSIHEKIIYCGSPYIFTSPAEPSMLGAIQASASIHLSDELSIRQDILSAKIALFRSYALKLGLPLVKPDAMTPIFFIGVGKPEVGYELCQKMMAAGYFLSIGIYPAVSVNNTGMRATVTVSHTDDQIMEMLDMLSRLLPIVLRDHNSSMERVFKAFKMPLSSDIVIE